VLPVTAPLLFIAVLAAGGASDSGGKDAGESASAWDAGSFLFWTVLVLLAAAVLVGALLLTARRNRAGAPAPAAARPDPVPRAVRDVAPEEGWDLAVLTFDRLEGAERAYADVRDRVGQPDWCRDVAFVEMHRHGRLNVHGTFAGRYLDERDLAAAEGGDSALLTELRADVPEGSSGVVAFAPPEEVERMLADFGEVPAVLKRRRVSSVEASALTDAVAGAPTATAPEEA
jgi:hypothetical protein